MPTPEINGADLDRYITRIPEHDSERAIDDAIDSMVNSNVIFIEEHASDIDGLFYDWYQQMQGVWFEHTGAPFDDECLPDSEVNDLYKALVVIRNRRKH